MENSRVAVSDEQIMLAVKQGDLRVDATLFDRCNIKVKEASGPMSLKTVYGNIDAQLKSLSDKSTLMLSSAYGNVDLAIPSAAKANLKMSASWGEMFTDFDIQVKSKTEKGLDCKNCNEFEGSIGGGGNLISLKSGYGNLYLRKK